MKLWASNMVQTVDEWRNQMVKKERGVGEASGLLTCCGGLLLHPGHGYNLVFGIMQDENIKYIRRQALT